MQWARDHSVVTLSTARPPTSLFIIGVSGDHGEYDCDRTGKFTKYPRSPAVSAVHKNNDSITTDRFSG